MPTTPPAGRAPLPPLPGACLVVVDVQRLFSDPSSPAFLPDWPMRCEALVTLARGFLERGLPVIRTRHVHPDGDEGGTMGLFFRRLQREGDPFSEPDPVVASALAGTSLVDKARFSALTVPAVAAVAQVADPGAGRRPNAPLHPCDRGGCSAPGPAARCRVGCLRGGCRRGSPRGAAGAGARTCPCGDIAGDPGGPGPGEGHVTRGSPNAGEVAVARECVGTDATDGAADLVVVGLGPAGIACVLQAVREGLRVVAIND
jgi:hypothetical protein